MRALLLPFGSSGDVHPFIGIGLALKKRGHHVTVITNGYFRSLVENAGLDFVELGTAQEYLAVADNPDLWSPRRSFRVIAEHAARFLRPTYQRIAERFVPGDTIVAAGSLAFGARFAEDKLGVPTAMIHLQPSLFRSVFDPPVYPGLRFLPTLPPWMVRPFFRLMDVIIDHAMAPAFNVFRAELGLSPVRSIMGTFWHSPRLTLGFWPAWFGAPQKDWPPSARLTGFPLFDGAGLEPMENDLEKFLSAGEPPIVFTAGSAMKVGNDFFRESVDAARRLNRRALLVTRFADQLPTPLPSNVHHFDYAPFGSLFPRAAAIVHHGGIGTTAQALRAGRPQLIAHMAYDQPDNAARVERLGAGTGLPMARYRGAAVAKLLNRLLGDKTLAQRAQNISTRFFGIHPLEETADLLEGLLKKEIPQVD